MILLCAKFLYPLFAFDVPLGYDPGIYRYLFLRYAQSLQSFSMPELLPWAKEYPPGLFVLLAPLLILGLPVDALIGWIWNLVPVATLILLSWVTAKRSGVATGTCVLVIGLLSQAYFDGFFAMYWKTFAALFFAVLTYHLAQRQSPWFLLTALMTVMTHQQTGLILIVALGVWWVRCLPQLKHNHHFRMLSSFLVLAALVACVWYLPQWERAIWSPLKSILLLRGDNAPSGSFPEASFYLQTMGMVLLLGLVGFVRSFTREKGSLWQTSVIVCLIFIVFRLVFYKRFFLQLDFFLMPFAASALVWIWDSFHRGFRYCLVVLLFAQAVVSFHTMQLRVPSFTRSEINQISALAQILPDTAAVIALENVSGTWLRGWLPNYRIGAPGLFDYPQWTINDWGKFIDGTMQDRKVLLEELQGPVYFLISPSFSDFYGDRTQGVLQDPCLKKVENTPLVLSTCSET